MARVPRKTAEQRVAENEDSLDAFAKVASRFKAPQASEVLRLVSAVPTDLINIDYKVGVGGWPLRVTNVVHGPSNEGKTTFVAALMRSFVRRRHFALFVDAERTTSEEYARQIMGDDVYTSPLFRALPVESYEEAMEAVKGFCLNIKEGRDTGELPPRTSGIIVVDSLKNLLPAKVFNQIQELEERAAKEDKEGKGHPDGLSGRLGQIQAMYNTIWFVQLAALLANTDCSFVAIARENVKKEGSGMFARDVYEVGGGREVMFGPALRVRVERKYLFEELEAGKKKTFVGERHDVSIQKTKISQKLEKIPGCYFHTSNGVLSPAGLDFARDMLELGRELDIIKLSGSTYSFNGRRIVQGAERMRNALRENAELRGEVEHAIRSWKREP